MNNNQICLVCGNQNIPCKFELLIASHEICSCCGCQYGLDVLCKEDVIRYRNEWLENGAERFDEELECKLDKATSWSIELAKKQIRLIPHGLMNKLPDCVKTKETTISLPHD